MQNAGSLIFLALLIGLFYFMLIRPQKRQAEQRRQLIQSIEVGDDVITIGGIHGIVRSIGDDDMEVEISPGTIVRFVKSAVARKVYDEVEDDDALAETADDDDV